MANITKTFAAKAGAQAAWDKISDIGAVDKLLDMVSACSLDGDTRHCTFADGMQVSERIITVDNDARRIVYTVTDGPMPIEFHVAILQVVDKGDAAEVVWTVDLKPDELAAPLSEMMEAAAQNMAQVLA